MSRPFSDTYAPIVRAQLVKQEVDALSAEARQCTDIERLCAIRAELDVRLESLREIHRQQLIDLAASPQPRRRWWRLWR